MVLYSPTKPFDLAALKSGSKSSIPEASKEYSLLLSAKLSNPTMLEFIPRPCGVHSGIGTICPWIECGIPIAEEVAEGPGCIEPFPGIARRYDGWTNWGAAAYLADELNPVARGEEDGGSITEITGELPMLDPPRDSGTTDDIDPSQPFSF